MQTNNSKEKVRQLQNKLYLTAKKCDSRRFHALYDNAVERRMSESRVRENLMHGLMRGG